MTAAVEPPDAEGATSATVAPGVEDALVAVLDDGGRPGFVAALQIQLAGTATVEVRREASGNRSPPAVPRASELVLEEGLRGAVWIDSEGPQVLVYVVGRRSGRAVVEIMEAETADSADFDRALALRAATLLETLTTDSADASRPSVSAPETAEHPEAPPIPPSDISAWGLRGALGLTAASPTGTVPWLPGIGASVGASLRLSGLLLVGSVGVEGMLPFDHRASAGLESPGRVSSVEVRPWLGLRGLLDLPPMRVGAELRGTLRIVASDGVTPAGAAGGATHILPELAVSAAVEWPLMASFGLFLELGCALTLVEQRLFINDAQAATLGRARLQAALGVIFDTAL